MPWHFIFLIHESLNNSCYSPSIPYRYYSSELFSAVGSTRNHKTIFALRKKTDEALYSKTIRKKEKTIFSLSMSIGIQCIRGNVAFIEHAYASESGRLIIRSYFSLVYHTECKNFQANECRIECKSLVFSGDTKIFHYY